MDNIWIKYGYDIHSLSMPTSLRSTKKSSKWEGDRAQNVKTDRIQNARVTLCRIVNSVSVQNSVL